MQAVLHEPEWEAFQREATAYHEAGHAVAHYVLRLPFEAVTIVANMVYAGCVTLAPDDRAQMVAIIDRDEAIPLSQADRDLLWRHLVTLYAGGMAQIKAERDVWGSVGDSNDRYRTIELVVTLEPENPERAEQAGQAVAWRLVECAGNWGAVCDLAAALLARDTLTYGQACPIIEKALRRSHRRRRCFQCRELQRHQEPPR